jgi:hypothetical protein
MQLVFLLLLLSPPFLYFGLVWLSYAKRSVRPRRFVVAGALLGGLPLAAFLAVLVSVSGQPGAAFGMVGLTGLTLPFVSAGLGLILGAIARIIGDRRSRAAGRWVMGAAVALPLLFLLAGYINAVDLRDRRAAELAERELQTRQLVTLDGDATAPRVTGFLFAPEAPHTQLSYRCWPRIPTYGCFPEDRAAPLPELRVGDVAAEAAVLRTLTILPVGDGCRPVRQCVPEKRFQAWCDRREDLSDTVWCTSPPRQKFVFEPHDDRTQPMAFWADDVTYPDLPPLGTNEDGSPIRIMCSKTRDSVMARRPPEKRQRLCYVRFRPSAHIRGVITLDGSDDLSGDAEHALARGRALFEQMSR